MIFSKAQNSRSGLSRVNPFQAMKLRMAQQQQGSQYFFRCCAGVISSGSIFHNGGSLVKHVFCFFSWMQGKKWKIDKVGTPQDGLWLLKDKDEKNTTHLGFYMDLINIFFVGIQPFSQSFIWDIIVSILNTRYFICFFVFKHFIHIQHIIWNQLVYQTDGLVIHHIQPHQPYLTLSAYLTYLFNQSTLGLKRNMPLWYASIVFYHACGVYMNVNGWECTVQLVHLYYSEFDSLDKKF